MRDVITNITEADPYHLDIQIAPELLTINKRFGDSAVHSFSLPLGELAARREFYASACWRIGIAAGGQVMLRNLFGRTLVERLSPPDATRFDGVTADLFLLIPFADSDFEEMGYTVCKHPHGTFTSNKPFVSKPFDIPKGAFMNWLPSFEISGPETIQADAAEVFTIAGMWQGSPTARLMQVFMEHYNGYVSKTQFNLEGSASFKVAAWGLEPGDTITLRPGFKHIAARNAKVIRVV